MLTSFSITQSAYTSKETLDLGIVHHNFKLLILLNLWGVKTETGHLSFQIGNLIHLRYLYLSIRASNITRLPKSIGNMKNLLTLDYRNINSSNHVIIPDVFGKLVQLRHLFLPTECPWSPEELHLSALENLQTLWGVRHGWQYDWFKRDMGGLSNSVKKLKVIVSTEADLEAAFNCPSLKSDRTHTFFCHWSDDVVLPSHQVNSIFSVSLHLHKLVLVGEMEEKKLSVVQPSNLVILELKDNGLNDEDLIVAAGALAYLKSLRLSNSYLGTVFTCRRCSFQLEELYLASLPNLTTWEIQNGAMPCLKGLEIITCGKLQNFPQGSQFVGSLEKLTFYGVPEEFVEKVEEYGWSKQRLRQPHNIEEIIKECRSPVEMSSLSKLYEQLTVGTFLNNNRQKYWVIRQNEHYYNCFMLYIKDLSLWVCDSRGIYHRKVDYEDANAIWKKVEKSNDGELVAYVGKRESTVDDTNLYQVRGEFNTKNLTPGVIYGIAYLVKLPSSASEWKMQLTCNLRLRYLDFLPQKHELGDKLREKWIRLSVGEYDTSIGLGELSFSLSGIPAGVAIRGVIIEPNP